jgi:phosphoribosylaminoimidazole-succinocarboxamide synthase
MQALTSNSFHFKGQTKVYNGKVRDVYTLENGLLVMVASDRISAFDHILPKGIPFKGQVLYRPELADCYARSVCRYWLCL